MPSRLSPRQTEILRLIAHGRTNTRIGIRLGLTENTVKIHVSRLLKAIGAHNRSHAVFLGCKHGLIPMGALDSEPAGKKRGA